MRLRGATTGCATLVLLVAGCVGDAPEFTLCPAGRIDCEGACIDPLTDWRHCGASDCRQAATSGTVCPAQGYCSQGTCHESDGPFVSPGDPEDGATVALPRSVTYQISWVEPRTVRFTTDGTSPLAGSASATETAAPMTTLVTPGAQLRWHAVGDQGERSFATSPASTQGHGMVVEDVAFSKSGSATVVASPGEPLQLTGRMQCWSASEGHPDRGQTIACGALYGTKGACGVTSLEETFAASAPSSFEVRPVAPSAPGVYYVRAGYVVSSSCFNFQVPMFNSFPIARIIVR